MRHLAPLLAASSATLGQGSVAPISNWLLASSTNASVANLAVYSTVAFQPDPAAWLPVTVPGTVVGGLIANGWWPEIMHGQNIFAVNSSLFDVPWIYRAEFTPALSSGGGAVFLRFLGLNYRAQIWVNGVEVAPPASTAGAFRHFTIDVTALVAASGVPSAVAVSLDRQHDRSLPSSNHDVDLGITFVDWAPLPPDSSLGIWAGVDLVQTPGLVTLRYPLVATKLLASADLVAASLTVAVELTNWGTASASGLLSGVVFAPDNSTDVVSGFSQPFSLLPGETATIAFTPVAFPQLVLRRPELWWPAQMGSPTMYTLALNVTTRSGDRTPEFLSDSISARFGIREITSAIDASGNRAFSVNGLPLLIRGAGLAPDLFLRSAGAVAADRLASAIAYTRDMGLNTLRLEGKMEASSSRNGSTAYFPTYHPAPRSPMHSTTSLTRPGYL